jgi:uncharacterized membrane protein
MSTQCDYNASSTCATMISPFPIHNQQKMINLNVYIFLCNKNMLSSHSYNMTWKHIKIATIGTKTRTILMTGRRTNYIFIGMIYMCIYICVSLISFLLTLLHFESM